MCTKKVGSLIFVFNQRKSMIFKNRKNTERKYKFKELKVYASTEWLAEGKKKYRKVFENIQTTYLYAELSFFNKLFDEEDWVADIRLKCFRLQETNRELLCDLEVSQQVTKEENIVFIREGWGHEEPGYFWKRGDYIWEAYIDDELAGVTKFYVEDGGPVTEAFNPYFEILNVRLFEGSNEGMTQEKREYLKKFDAHNTRYVWVEFAFDNLQEKSWYCELVFNFYNDSGQLKGQTIELRHVKTDETDVVITTGWGSDNKGTWYHDRYSVEVTFMDELIAVVPFECADAMVKGDAPLLTQEEGSFNVSAFYGDKDEEEDTSKETLEELLERIDGMIGLDPVKRKVHDYIEYLEFLKLRQQNGYETDSTLQLHAIFLGNPGTGKTTIAKILGKIFHRMGLLSRGQFMEVGRAELIGQYIGQTAPKVKDVIDQARGGVLFIDEAYALVRNEEDDKDYGQEVLEVLVKEMSDGPGDIAIFAAGYPRQMGPFLNFNPGLKSRFKMIFDFPDYQPAELLQISEKMSKEQKVVFSKPAKEFLLQKLTDAYRERDEKFGNARMVATLIEDTKMQMGLRVIRSKAHEKRDPKKALETIEKADLEAVYVKSVDKKLHLSIDQAELKLAMQELHSMTGLTGVKKELDELVNLVEYFNDVGKDVMGELSFHAVFKGNPGTGKTTVARLWARIFKALGILERGHLVECSRKDLVAGFVGQTPLKTQKMIEKAKGGVLFIDEAYSLTHNDPNDFGKEAIEVLLKEMEDHRQDLAVIVAGYTEPMTKFLESNPGLKSRFDKELMFEDLNPNELVEVAIAMFKKEEVTLDKAVKTVFAEKAEELLRTKDNYFGNARTMRKIVSEAVKRHHLRLASLPKTKRTKAQIKNISAEDLINAFDSETKGSRPRIGFK